MDVAVIGAGRAGTAIAVLLDRAGHRIVGVSGRADTAERAERFLPGVPVLDSAAAARDAELVLVAVPDDLIEPVVEAIAAAGAVSHGPWVAHLSGATPLSILDAARDAGARRLGLHPLQTFPDVEAAIERLPGCTVAIGADDDEGYVVGERLAEDIGGVPFRLPDEHRAIYHAAAVFASNYLVAAAGVAELLLASAGVPDPTAALAALQEATVANVARVGPMQALTGPVVRGDGVTVSRNLEALSDRAPWAVDAYVEMARVAVDLAMRSGRLTSEGGARIEEALRPWT